MVVAHPQLAYYAYFALAVYALASLWVRRHAGGAFLANGLAGGMLAVVTAAGVAAVVLLPMYRYLREDSPRAGPGRGFEYSASWSLRLMPLRYMTSLDRRPWSCQKRAHC